MEETRMRAYSNLSRRNMLFGAGTLATAGALIPAASLAKAPMLNTPAPYFYRFKLGDAEATIVSDGTLPLGDPHASFSGLAPAELDQQLTDNFLPVKDAVLEQNILVLNTGDRVIVFDTGMGSSNLFGNTTGKMIANMSQAGIDPRSVDAVVMSHAHIDHCGGCMAEDNIRNFPTRNIISRRPITITGPTKRRFPRNTKPSSIRRRRISCRTATAWYSSRTARNSCPASRRSPRRDTRSATRSS
jgi:glyoxylase-like metal-dependent hydrolase (beta-lactamase superfamily II)